MTIKTIDGTEITYNESTLKDTFNNLDKDESQRESWLGVLISFTILSALALLACSLLILNIVLPQKPVSTGSTGYKVGKWIIIVLSVIFVMLCLIGSVKWKFHNDISKIRDFGAQSLTGKQPSSDDAAKYLAIWESQSVRKHINDAINNFYTTYFAFKKKEKLDTDVVARMNKIRNLFNAFRPTAYFGIEQVNHQLRTRLNLVSTSVILITTCFLLYMFGKFKTTFGVLIGVSGFVIIPYTVMQSRKDEYVAIATKYINSIDYVNDIEQFKKETDRFVARQPFSRRRVGDEFLQYVKWISVIIMSVGAFFTLSVGFAYITKNESMGNALNWVSLTTFLITLIIVPTLIVILSVAYS